MNFFKKIIGSRNDRLLKKYLIILQEVNAFSEILKSLKDSEFHDITKKLKNDFIDGRKLEEIMPYAYALLREASERVLGMRHFDEQILGGIALHEGKITEMKTGEGKTLVATLPAYLNSLSGNAVHIITVNDYLAKRDSEWMSKLYNFMGLSTGVIISGQSIEEKKKAYQSNIVYGTNNEFGFDYLRDNMISSNELKVQNILTFAIIDEVDSILIDEARTPLIISGFTNENPKLYKKINSLVKYLKKGNEDEEDCDFFIDEKSKSAYLTEKGHDTYEKLLIENRIIDHGENLYHPSNINLQHYIGTALRANFLFTSNVDYLVEDSKVIIIDEFTGRKMPGRRWSDGLHQAIEAKENLTIENENQTLASITFQNYFRLYTKLSGMTGTADTEAQELLEIYGLEVVIIPTHKKMIRKDFGDLVYLTLREKFDAIISDIKQCKSKNQPVLIGTASIEVSEYLSKKLNKEKITHNVLNAKQHQKESMIIENAGAPGCVTIATNMAGRGTDIVLGGKKDNEKIEEWKKKNKSVIESGGLHVIGTERHESRRVDNQLRGRSGRQGDPGSSRFYLSLEDNLMRIFSSEKVGLFMKKLGMKEGEAIEHKWVSRAIENAQKKVEGHNFDIRKHLLDYDDVANEQRKYVYKKRNEFLTEKNTKHFIEDIIEEVFSEIIKKYNNVIKDNIEEINNILIKDFNIQIDILEIIKNSTKNEEIVNKFINNVKNIFSEKVLFINEELYIKVTKEVFINIIDKNWIEHIQSMDYLRQGIGLRSYAQKNPKQEYKREAFDMFLTMQDNINYTFLSILFKLDFKVLDITTNVENNLDSIKYSKESSVNKINSRKGNKKMKKKRK